MSWGPYDIYVQEPAGVTSVPCMYDGIAGPAPEGMGPFCRFIGGGLGLGNTPAGMVATWRKPAPCV